METFATARDLVPETPALVIDLPTVEHNSRKLVNYARQHSLNVRPHTKTHKSARIAKLQMEHGCSGLTAAKAGEAEVMAEATQDILIAYPAVDPVRTARIALLARNKTVRVAVDTLAGLAALASAAQAAKTTIGILVDIDIGFHRTGVQSPELSLELAQFVAEHSPALRLDGIFFYPGHVWSPAAEQQADLTPIEDMLSRSIEIWKSAGLTAPIVSGGSTPTAYQSHLVPSQTEIRPGTYLYNDMNTVDGGYCTLDEVAAGVICTVVSTAVPGKVVIDAGSKTFTTDRNAKFPDSGHGRVLEYPEAKVSRLSEEHGELDISRSSRIPKVGDRVTVIPNHICPCVNLQRRAWLQVEPGRFETLQIDARGLLT